MENTVTINRKVAADSGSKVRGTRTSAEDRKDHLRVWREIYQDVRRQWAEAENYRSREDK